MGFRKIDNNEVNRLLALLASCNTSDKTPDFNTHLKNLVSLYEESQQSSMHVYGLNIDSEIVVSDLNVNINIMFSKIKGAGRLVFEKTKFNKNVTFNNLVNYQSKEIVLRSCIIGDQLKLTNLLNEDLTFKIYECKSGVNLELQKVSIERLFFKESKLGKFTFLDTEIKSVIADKCDIVSNVVLSLNSVNQLRFVLVNRCIFSLDTNLDLSGLRREVDFQLFVRYCKLNKQFICKPSVQMTFQKYFSVRGLESEHQVFALSNIVFTKDLNLTGLNFSKFIIENCSFSKVFKMTKIKTDELILKGGACSGTAVFDLKTNGFQALHSFNFQGDIFFDRSEFGSFLCNAKFQKFCSFKYCIFIKAPDFLGSNFSKHVTFYGAAFKDVRSLEADGRYRFLKESMSKAGNDVDELLFSSYELESRIKDYGFKNFFEYLISKAYSLLNNYGRSLFRPFMWIVIFWFVFSLFYQFCDKSFFVDSQKIGIKANIENNYKPLEVKHDLSVLSWTYKMYYEPRYMQSMKFSAINMLGPLRLLSQFDAFSQAHFRYVLVSWLQSVIATILWYLLGSGIKRRFRTG